jgi:hypothetical protein
MGRPISYRRQKELSVVNSQPGLCVDGTVEPRPELRLELLDKFEGSITVGTSVVETVEPKAVDKIGPQLEILDESTEFD